MHNRYRYLISELVFHQKFRKLHRLLTDMEFKHANSGICLLYKEQMPELVFFKPKTKILIIHIIILKSRITKARHRH